MTPPHVGAGWMMQAARTALVGMARLAVALLAIGCGTGTDVGPDTGTYTDPDTGTDLSVDVGPDRGVGCVTPL